MDDKMTTVRFDTHFVPVLFLYRTPRNFVETEKQQQHLHQQIQMEMKDIRHDFIKSIRFCIFVVCVILVRCLGIRCLGFWNIVAAHLYTWDSSLGARATDNGGDHSLPALYPTTKLISWLTIDCIFFLSSLWPNIHRHDRETMRCVCSAIF